jgi:hypothetical protein
VADVPSGFSLTPPQETKKKKKISVDNDITFVGTGVGDGGDNHETPSHH